MTTTLCHQCHHAVPEGAVYCPECGAPQLRVIPRADNEQESEAAQLPDHTSGVAWPAALKSAAIFAIPTGLLLTLRAVGGLLALLCIAGGAVLALRQYRKWAPRAPRLTPKLGGRIGFTFGLFAVGVNAATESVRLVVERYLLHGGAAIDARMHGYAQLEIDLMKQSDPDAVAHLDWLTRFWLSPEGAGTLLLLSMAASALMVLFFAWLTGRFAARSEGGLRRRTS